jgi:hypothetical protein
MQLAPDLEHLERNRSFFFQAGVLEKHLRGFPQQNCVRHELLGCVLIQPLWMSSKTASPAEKAVDVLLCPPNECRLLSQPVSSEET